MLPATSEFTVEVSQGPTNASFSALPKQTIRPSLSTPITITAPLQDAGTGDLRLPKGPIAVSWTAPTAGDPGVDGGIAEQRLIASAKFFGSGGEGSKEAQIFCDAPLAAGGFTIPSELVNDAVAQTAPITGTPTGALLQLHAGGQKVVPVKNTLYVITVANDTSTSSLAANLVIQ